MGKRIVFKIYDNVFKILALKFKQKTISEQTKCEMVTLSGLQNNSAHVRCSRDHGYVKRN